MFCIKYVCIRQWCWPGVYASPFSHALVLYFSECINGSFQCELKPDKPANCTDADEILECRNNMIPREPFHCAYTCDYYEPDQSCNTYERERKCGCPPDQVLADDVCFTLGPGCSKLTHR